MAFEHRARIARGFAPRKWGPWHIVPAGRSWENTALCGTSTYRANRMDRQTEYDLAAAVDGKLCAKCEHIFRKGSS